MPMLYTVRDDESGQVLISTCDRELALDCYEVEGVFNQYVSLEMKELFSFGTQTAQ